MSRDASFPSLVVPPRRYTADDAGGRADKFGWLGSATPNISVADSKLEFSLNFSRAGVLAVEYLKSYDWNGTVALSVDGAQLHENALSAHWEDRSTQRATTTFAFGTHMNITSQSRKRLPNQYHIRGFAAGVHNVIIFRPSPAKNHGRSVQALRACHMPGIQGRRNAEECDRRAERRRSAEECDRAERRRGAEKCDCGDERCFERLAGRARTCARYR